jgi:hypothetical protein
MNTNCTKKQSILVSNNQLVPECAVTDYLFRCPVTGSDVQGFLIEQAPSVDPDSCMSVTCLTCGHMHLVNFKTGDTIEEERGPVWRFKVRNIRAASS